MTFDHLPVFQITNKDSELYGEYVKKTALLLSKPYFQVHKMFERERWTLEEITRNYKNATEHSGSVSGEIAWWANRKRRNACN